MSTKIHNGYRLPKIRKAKLIKVQVATQLAIRESVYMLDLYQVGFNVPDIKQSVFGFGYHKVEERFRKFKKGPYRDPLYDLRFELILFLTDPVLAIFIGEQKAMQSIIKTHPDIEEYAYWNNSDPPENMSDEDWEQREKDWKFLDGPICNQGIIIAMDDMIFYDTNERSFSPDVIPNWEHRCIETAKNIILHKIDQKQIFVPGVSDNTDEKQNPITNINIIYQWLQKGDGKKLIDDEIEHIKPILNHTLTYQHIFKSPFESFTQTDRLQQ